MRWRVVQYQYFMGLFHDDLGVRIKGMKGEGEINPVVYIDQPTIRPAPLYQHIAGLPASPGTASASSWTMPGGSSPS